MFKTFRAVELGVKILQLVHELIAFSVIIKDRYNDNNNSNYIYITRNIS